MASCWKENWERQESIELDVLETVGCQHSQQCQQTCLTESISSRSQVSLCHFHPVSCPSFRLLAPSTRESRSTPPDLGKLTESNRLPSRSPMYDVLANNATKTIVWIGCVQDLRESDWSKGEIRWLK